MSRISFVLSHLFAICYPTYTLRQRKNGSYFADNIFKYIWLNEKKKKIFKYNLT